MPAVQKTALTALENKPLDFSWCGGGPDKQWWGVGKGISGI